MKVVKKHAIILWNNVFERYELVNEAGCTAKPVGDFGRAQELIKEWGYTEVYVNSKIGRRILANLGTRKL